MLKEFPHAEITGVDLVPPPLDPEQLPDNFRVEIDDINLGLAHFYGKFDVVHMRDVYLGIIGKLISLVLGVHTFPRRRLQFFFLFPFDWNAPPFSISLSFD